MRVTLIVAATDKDVIGDGGDLPWHLRPDLARFRRLTRGHAVVVGRLTQESIVRRLGKPLPGRKTVVVSRSPAPESGPPQATSVESALDLARRIETGDEVFVIGGAQVYTAALPAVDRIELTRVHADIAGDTALPADWLDGYRLVASEPGTPVDGGPAYTWLTYERR